MTNSKRFDVCIINDETHEITSIIGSNVTETRANIRETIGISRINENHSIEIMPHNPDRKIGDIV